MSPRSPDGRILSVVCAASVACVVSGASGRAQAQQGPEAPAHGTPALPAAVELVPPQCEAPGLPVERVLELLRIELRGDGIDRVTLAREDGAPMPTEGGDAEDDPGTDEGGGPPLGIITITAERCTPDTKRYLVAIDDAATHKRVERLLDLGEVNPAARPRALVLAITELLRASWAELAIPDAPVEPRVPTEVREAVVVRLREATELERPRPSPREVQERAAPPGPSAPGPALDLGVLVRAFPSASTALVGGRLGVAFPELAGTPLVIRVGADVGHGTTLHDLGEIGVWLVTGGASVGAGLARESLQLDVGARLEIGWSRAEGSPAREDVLGGRGSAGVVLVLVESRVAARIAGPLWARLDLGAGGAVRELEALADGRAVAGPKGALITVHAGVGLEL